MCFSLWSINSSQFSSLFLKRCIFCWFFWCLSTFFVFWYIFWFQIELFSCNKVKLKSHNLCRNPSIFFFGTNKNLFIVKLNFTAHDIIIGIWIHLLSWSQNIGTWSWYLWPDNLSARNICLLAFSEKACKIKYIRYFQFFLAVSLDNCLDLFDIVSIVGILIAKIFFIPTTTTYINLVFFYISYLSFYLPIWCFRVMSFI